MNKDGYFRKNWGNVHEMFHRFIYRAHNGDIPDGFEVDHTCGVRSCCNPKHLRALDGSEHTIHTNKVRYADRKREALSYWQDKPVSGAALGKVFNVSFSSACGWIREWKMAA